MNIWKKFRDEVCDDHNSFEYLWRGQTLIFEKKHSMLKNFIEEEIGIKRKKKKIIKEKLK